MLETVLTASVVALCCSLGVHFLLTWETRIRLRRLERQYEDYDARLQTEQKRRAAAASVESRRGTLHPTDEAAVARVAAGARVQAAPDDFPAWFDTIARK